MFGPTSRLKKAAACLSLLVIVSGVSASGATAAPAASALDVDPCSLLTVDEAGAIIGGVQMGPVAEKNPSGQVLDCGFVASAGGLLMVSVSDAEHWEMRKGFLRPDDHLINVPGIGQDAIHISPDDGAHMLAVLTPPYVLEVRTTMDTEQDQQVVMAAAEKALPRLK